MTKGKKINVSTEEKIKDAARKLFTRRGYAATKTRDIAAEAGINLALLNYYFRSKEALFAIVMRENMQHFVQGLSVILNNKNTSIEEKITQLVSNYIDMLIVNQDMPLFVLTVLRNHPEKLPIESKLQNSYFLKQIQAAVKAKEIEAVHPMHLMLNILGLTIFPFVGKPIFKHVSGMEDEEFLKMMEERKQLIPQWIVLMLKGKRAY